MDVQTAQAAQAATVVSPKRPLNVRAGSAVWTAQLRTLSHGSSVTIVCQVRGQRIDQGTVRVTDLWDRLADGTYVSDAWIRRPQEVPACETATPVAAAAAAPAAVAGTVASGGIPLKARSAPAHGAPLVAALANGTALTLTCQVRGENIAGRVRTTPMWNRLPSGTYVSDAYVRRSATPPPCAATAPPPAAAPAAPAAPPAAAGRWVSPLPGFTARPGFRTPRNPNHIGVDIMSFTGTPIRAASAGTVVEVVCNIEAGHSCDQTGSASIGGCGWYVKLQHAGGIATLYCHMVRRAIVQPGQKVAAGQVIGYVGSSGNSSAPHLHYEVHVNAPPTGPYNAVDPLPFMRSHGAPIG
ncbi:peptidoglycan DD-metalloendopeptidase family protein [Dactylosporangium sucinum]|uniref:peptidoglycan DD-metalloendopeptidase family protein n=1 Tax=Dactylosporangium sucinum TaxID=1424081 RepID=UPI00167DA74D|nr:peptidoglycan DD-metalloendopeptidase family protein [Dactylosporangium sucinum]